MVLNILAGGFPLLARSSNSSVYATLIILISKERCAPHVQRPSANVLCHALFCSFATDIIVFFKSVIFNPISYQGVSAMPCSTKRKKVETAIHTCPSCSHKTSYTVGAKHVKCENCLRAAVDLSPDVSSPETGATFLQTQALSALRTSRRNNKGLGGLSTDDESSTDDDGEI